MGVPSFEPQALPFLAHDLGQAPYFLTLADRRCQFWVVSLGNPHVVCDADESPCEFQEAVGRAFNQEPRFPQGVNVGFMRWRSSTALSLRVYERGVGFTAACGSGACAAVAVARRRGLVDNWVTVSQRGGDGTVFFSNFEQSMRLSGPAEWIMKPTLFQENELC